MNLFELLDLTIADFVCIKDENKILYSGDIRETPYKLLRRRVIAFGVGDIGDHFIGLIIKI